LDRFENGKFNMQEGIIDFIEPDDKGKQHKEAFEISKEDTDKLVGEIKRVAGEILNLTFWNKRCGEKDCVFCPLRDMMK